MRTSSDEVGRLTDVVRKLAKSVLPKRWLPYAFLEEPYFFIRPDKRKIQRLKNAHAAERCVVIGNGPSLNKIDLLKLNAEVTFGFNGIFYKTEEVGFRPTYYVVEDKAVMRDNRERINDYQGPTKFFPINYKNQISNRSNCVFFRMNSGFYQVDSPHFGIPRFSVDFAKRLYCGQSVTMLALQIAYYMGFTQVYLVGMDFSYEIPESALVRGKEILSTENDPNHFHPSYFGAGKTWHDPQLDKVYKSYQMMKLMYEQDERVILNATVGGELELFDRVDFDRVFN